MIRYVDEDLPVLVHSVNAQRTPVMVKEPAAAGFDVVRMPMDQLEKETFLEWLDEAREAWMDRIEEEA